jgi:hypothetical protein
MKTPPQASIQLNFSGPLAKNQGAAIWFVQENFSENYHVADMISSNSWATGMTQAGLTFFG